MNIANNPTGLPGQYSLTPARLNNSLSPAILDNPDKYFVSIDRFHIPCASIPTIMARFQPGYADTIWSVTLVNNVANLLNQQYIQWVPESEGTGSAGDSSFLYDVTSFLQMVNTALATAYAAVHDQQTSGAPYFIFDPIGQVISLIANAEDYMTDSLTTSGLVPNISIYCNAALFDQFFCGLPRYDRGLNAGDGTDRAFRVMNLDTNWYQSNEDTPVYPRTLLQMTQQYPSLSTISPFASMQILSSALPIRKTYTQTNSATSGVLATSPVLRQFLAELAPSQLPNTYLDYAPAFPIQIDLFGGQPLVQISLEIQWTDKYGGVHPLNVPIGDSLVVEFMFTLKKTSAA